MVGPGWTGLKVGRSVSRAGSLSKAPRQDSTGFVQVTARRLPAQAGASSSLDLFTWGPPAVVGDGWHGLTGGVGQGTAQRC